MGLLDGFLPNYLPEDPDKREAARMGLLNFGASMLAASNKGLLPALGVGMLNGSGTYNAQLANVPHAQLQKLQLDEAKRASASNIAISDAARMSLPEGGQFDQNGFLSKVMAIDPLKGLEYRKSMAKELPFNKVDAKDYTPESVAKFSQTNNYADLVPARKMEVAPSGQVFNPYQVAPGTVFADPNKPFGFGEGGMLVPNTPYQQYELGKARAGSTKVNVSNNTTQESEQSKEYGKTLGGIRSTITQSAFNAPATMAKLDRFETLLDGVGSSTDGAVKMAQFANSMGLKVDSKLGNKEAAAALTRELAAALRKPGMGAQSDADLENFMQQVPSLSQTEGGRKEIIKTIRAATARDIEIGKLARTYAGRNNGVIDDGFMDVVSDYVAKNPVVQRQSTSGRPNAFPDVSSIDAELARRKGK